MFKQTLLYGLAVFGMLSACDSPMNVDANRQSTLIDNLPNLPFPVDNALGKRMAPCIQDGQLSILLQFRHDNRTLDDFVIESMDLYSGEYDIEFDPQLRFPSTLTDWCVWSFMADLSVQDLESFTQRDQPVTMIINGEYALPLTIDMSVFQSTTRVSGYHLADAEPGVSGLKTLHIRNLCDDSWTVESLVLDDPAGALEPVVQALPRTLAAGEDFDVILKYEPKERGEYSAIVNLGILTASGLRYTRECRINGRVN